MSVPVFYARADDARAPDLALGHAELCAGPCVWSRAMKLTGRETESVYTRYAIADERDLHEAVEQLAGVSTGASE